MSAISTYFKSIFHSLFTVLVGMKITGLHLFKRSVTIQYPNVKKPIPERARNRLYVNIDDCIGCLQCAAACPVDCITIETIKATPDVDLGMTSKNTKKRLYIAQFDIDCAKCCYCGLCTYPCPTECIVMTEVYEYSEYERKNLVYSFATMTPEDSIAARRRLQQYEAEQAAKKVHIQPKPTPPSGTDAAPATT
ncbi:MAG: NADH-quinone oxidoreductase subunit I [Bacteroidetes bacterium]|nr:NADH-quinone oxidoreductase subunit I [Bacteroidota bacterium]